MSSMRSGGQVATGAAVAAAIWCRSVGPVARGPTLAAANLCFLLRSRPGAAAEVSPPSLMPAIAAADATVGAVGGGGGGVAAAGRFFTDIATAKLVVGVDGRGLAQAMVGRCSAVMSECSGVTKFVSCKDTLWYSGSATKPKKRHAER